MILLTSELIANEVSCSFFSLQMVITELARWKLELDVDNKLTLFNRPVPIWVQNGYKYIGVFGFGAACSQLLTDIAKYEIGRLRPHFFNVSSFNFYFYYQIQMQFCETWSCNLWIFMLFFLRPILIVLQIGYLSCLQATNSFSIFIFKC